MRDETLYDEHPVLHGDPAELARAHRRLWHLYEIGKLLTRFQSVGETVPAVLTLVSESVPLCIASLILEEGGPDRTRVSTWHSEGMSPVRLDVAATNGRVAYAHLVSHTMSPHFEAETRSGTPLHPCGGPPPAEEPGTSAFLLLPLVVDQNRIFGALQVQGRRPFTETDLIFVNAVVNQLAIALDRAAIAKARQAAAELGRTLAEEAAVLARRDGELQRFLSETTELFSSSLDLRATLAAVARAAVPLLGDVCVVDEVDEGDRIRRAEVVFADPRRQHLADRVREFAPSIHWNTPSARALRSRETVVISELPSLTIVAHDAPHAELITELGVHSTIAVPLVARGEALGVLSFAICDPARRYGDRDVALAEEVGRRATVAIDNARLFERAQRETQARQDMLAIVSHELRNPLSSIGAALSILDYAPDDVPTRNHARAAIGRQLAQMTRLVGDLLDVSRVTNGKLELRRETVELGSVLRDAIENCRGAMEAKHLAFSLGPPGSPVHVVGDALRLVQVFSNLLTNACKFTDAGGHVRLAVEVRGLEAVVSVEDDGIGIAPSMLAPIFGMFTQAGAGHERTQGGLGIGLALVRSLVELHGGSVVALSDGVGHGSEFVVRLPVVGPPRPPAASVRSSSVPTVATARRVLVVDDNVDAAESLSRILGMSGNEVLVAHDGIAAVAMAENFRPDVVILDIGIPGLNGHDAARSIRATQWGRTTHLVAVTGWGEDEDRTRSEEAGFDHHMVKPVDAHVLVDLIVAGRAPRSGGGSPAAGPRTAPR